MKDFIYKEYIKDGKRYRIIVEPNEKSKKVNFDFYKHIPYKKK